LKPGRFALSDGSGAMVPDDIEPNGIKEDKLMFTIN